MKQAIQIDLSELSKESSVFWSTGNYPTQALDGLAVEEVILHLKVLYLLSEKVLAAASYYFESPLTREVTNKLQALFEQGDILFFVDSTIESFLEHGIQKIEKSPPELVPYRNKEIVQERGESLDSLGYILRRPSHPISERIANLWVDDVCSSEPGSMGDYLHQLYKDGDMRLSIELKLVHIANNRGMQDFVWEYLKPKLLELQLSKAFLGMSRRKLAKMYAVATAELLGVPLDRSLSNLRSSYVTIRSQYDSGLFLSCMQTLGVVNSIRSLGETDLVALKYSPEFTWFRSFYFKLIESVNYEPGEAKEWLLKYRDAAQNFARSAVTAVDFIKTFKSLCSTLGKPQKKYARPLEVLLYTYEAANRLAIEDFIVRLASLDRQSSDDIWQVGLIEVTGQGGPSMTNLDPLAMSTLMKTIDFLFDEAKALMEERRQARKERGETDDTLENPDKISPPTEKDEVKTWTPKNIYLKDLTKEIKHYIEQIETCRNNKRHVERKINHVGGAMQAPIELVNDLEGQEECIKNYAQRLKDVVENIYGHKITIVGLD